MSGGGSSTPPRDYEKRWWLWCIAVVTVIALYDFRSRLGDEWTVAWLVEGIVALAGLVVVSVLWRGKIINHFLLLSAALCVYTAIRTAFGH